MRLSQDAHHMANLLLKYHPITTTNTQPPAEQPPAVKRTDKYSVDYKDFEKMASMEAPTNKPTSEMNPVQAQYAHTHDKRKERQLYQRPTEQKLANADYFKTQGNNAYSAKQYDKAAYMYQKALINFDYTFPQTKQQEDRMKDLQQKCHMNLALCQYQMKQADEATYNLKSVLRLNPENKKALYRLAMIAYDRDIFDECQRYLQKVDGEQAAVLKGKLKQKRAHYQKKSKKVSEGMFA